MGKRADFRFSQQEPWAKMFTSIDFESEGEVHHNTPMVKRFELEKPESTWVIPLSHVTAPKHEI